MPEPPPNLGRLFPPAYPDDPAAERGYRDLMRRELLEHHRGAFRALAESVDAQSLTEDQAAGWMTAFNDVRLILGTTLAVTDDWEPDFDDPATRDVSVLYLFLAELQSDLIEAMSAGLPDLPGEEAEFLADPWGDPPAGMRWAPPGAPPVADATQAPTYRGPQGGTTPPPGTDERGGD